MTSKRVCIKLQEDSKNEEMLEEHEKAKDGLPTNIHESLELDGEDGILVKGQDKLKHVVSSGVPVPQRAFPSNGIRVQDDEVNDSLILLMNEDGSLSVDPKQLNNLWGILDPNNPESYTTDGSFVGKGMPATLVRISSESSGSSVNLVVETSRSQPDVNLIPRQEEKKVNDSDDDVIFVSNVEPKKKKSTDDDIQIVGTKTVSTTLDPGDHNVFIGMDRDQLLRLEKLLKSDEAKEVLGDNVTAMLSMLNNEEDVTPNPVAHTLLDAVRMDHNYAIVPSVAVQSTDNSIIIESQSSSPTNVPTVPAPLPVLKPRGVGRPRKVLITQPVGSEPLVPRAQPADPAHPGATLVPVITPLRIGPPGEEGSSSAVVNVLSSTEAQECEEVVKPTKKKGIVSGPKKGIGLVTKGVPKIKIPKNLKGIKKTKKTPNVESQSITESESGQLLDDAMADALAAMETGNQTEDVVDNIQKESSPKTYSRTSRQKVQTPHETVFTQDVKEDEKSSELVIADIGNKVETGDVLTVTSNLKKHYPKRENRKPPAHLVDAFGPALFSTPDIIRRVSLDLKADEKKSSPDDPPNVIADFGTSNILQSVLDPDSLNTIPDPPVINGMELPHGGGTGPAVIVLMDEAISPSKSTALALSKRDCIKAPSDDEIMNEHVDNSRSDDAFDRSFNSVEPSENPATCELSNEVSTEKHSGEQIVTDSEPSTGNTNVPKGVKRKRRSVKKKKRHNSAMEPNPFENTPKRPKPIETDLWQPTNLHLESDEDIDIESDDISWNSEDDPDRLWCICKKPHNNRFMICCDSCNFWFHGKCVGITKAMGTQMEMKEEDWTCPSCVTKQKEAVEEEPMSFKKQSTMPVSESENTSASGSAQVPQIPEKRKRSRSKNRVPITEPLNTVQTHQVEGTKPAAGLMICVVCGKNEARVNSIFCSDTCILTHAQESGQPASPLKNPQTKEVVPKVPPLKLVHHKVILPKAGLQKGCPVKLLVPKASGFKLEMAKQVPSKTESPVVQQLEKAATEPIRPVKLSRLSINKKRTSGLIINLNAILNTSPEAMSEVTAESKANLKAVKESSDISKSRHVQLIEIKELPPSTPAKLGTPIKVPKTPTKIPPSPSKQSVSAPKVAKVPLAKGTDLSTKTKNISVPSSSHVKDKPSVKKVDSKRPASTEVQKKEEEKPVGPEPIRINVRKTLHELLLSRIQDCEDLKIIQDEKVKKIALKIEEELFALFKDTGMRYKSKYRSLVFNIKDPKNLTLFRKIAEKSVTPYQLVRLSPEELASQELADWRERESKHQLEMIKKNEMDLLSLSKTYVMKTHKGEQIIESEGIVPAATVAEMEDCLDPKEVALPSVTVLPDIKHIPTDTSKDKLKKHKSHRDRTKTRKKDKSKHSKSKHRDKHHESSKSDKNEKKKHKEKETKQKEVKGDTCVKPPVAESLTKDKKKIEPVQEHYIESVEPLPSTIIRSSTPISKESVVESMVSEIDTDLEPSSTVTIQTPDINSSDPSVCLTVWKGFISMLDVSKFFSTMQIVHGDPEELFDNLPDHMNIVGRISPNTVWDYISKMKKSGTKDILIVRFTAANEEEHIPYIALYSYLSGRNRLGVLGKMSKKIKDFYILPLSKHNPVPQVLLPLDGPGLEDNRPHLLLGIVVRSKQKYLPAESVYKVRMPRKYNSSPTDLSSSPPERSYTPPLRGVGLPEPGVTPPLLSSSLDYESTPPSSPYEQSLVERLDMKIKETSLSISTLSSKISGTGLQDDGDEPYSPGGSDDDISPVDVLGNPTTQQDMQRTMDELNRKIAEQKQQIESITSAIGAPSVPGVIRNVSEDGDEAYSPSSSFTPPRVATPPGIVTEPTPGPDITLPPHIQTLLNDIKKDRSDINLDPIINNLKLKLEESIIRGTSVPWRPMTDVQPYIPTEIKDDPVVTSTTASWTSSSSSSTSSPSVLPDTPPPSTSSVMGLSAQESAKNVVSLQTTSQSSQFQVSSTFTSSVQEVTNKSNVSLDSSSSGLSQQGSFSESCLTSQTTVRTSQLPQSTSDLSASQSTVPSSSPDSSGVFQTIPLMLGAISPSALFPKSEKASRATREDFSEQAKSRLTKYNKRGPTFKPSREIELELDDSSPIRTPIANEEEPPPPGVDTPPRPLPPPRCKSPQKPPQPTTTPEEEVEFVQPQYACPPPSYQPVSYPIPAMVPGPIVYPIRPPYYGPGYMPMGNMMHHAPGPMQLGYNPPYQEMHYPGPGGMYGESSQISTPNHDHNRSHPPYGRGNGHWKYKGKKRGRQEDRGFDNRPRGNQSKDRSHRRDSRDSKSNRERPSRRKKSRNKSRSRDRTKQNVSM